MKPNVYKVRLLAWSWSSTSRLIGSGITKKVAFFVNGVKMLTSLWCVCACAYVIVYVSQFKRDHISIV